MNFLIRHGDSVRPPVSALPSLKPSWVVLWPYFEFVEVFGAVDWKFANLDGPSITGEQRGHPN